MAADSDDLNGQASTSKRQAGGTNVLPGCWSRDQPVTGPDTVQHLKCNAGASMKNERNQGWFGPHAFLSSSKQDLQRTGCSAGETAVVIGGEAFDREDRSAAGETRSDHGEQRLSFRVILAETASDGALVAAASAWPPIRRCGI